MWAEISSPISTSGKYAATVAGRCSRRTPAKRSLGVKRRGMGVHAVGMDVSCGQALAGKGNRRTAPPAPHPPAAGVPRQLRGCNSSPSPTIWATCRALVARHKMHLPAAPGPATIHRPLVAAFLAGAADQDRRQGGPACRLHVLSAGRDLGSETVIPGNPYSHSTAVGTSAYMTNRKQRGAIKDDGQKHEVRASGELTRLRFMISRVETARVALKNKDEDGYQVDFGSKPAVRNARGTDAIATRNPYGKCRGNLSHSRAARSMHPPSFCSTSQPAPGRLRMTRPRNGDSRWPSCCTWRTRRSTAT